MYDTCSAFCCLYWHDTSPTQQASTVEIQRQQNSRCRYEVTSPSEVFCQACLVLTWSPRLLLQVARWLAYPSQPDWYSFLTSVAPVHLAWSRYRAWGEWKISRLGSWSGVERKSNSLDQEPPHLHQGILTGLSRLLWVVSWAKNFQVCSHSWRSRMYVSLPHQFLVI